MEVNILAFIATALFILVPTAFLLAWATAGLTTFYMFRIYLLTF